MALEGLDPDMPASLSGRSTNMASSAYSPHRDTSFDIPGVRRVSQQPVPSSYAYGAPPSPSRGDNARRHRSGSVAASASAMSTARSRRTAAGYDENAEGDESIAEEVDDSLLQQSRFQGGPSEPAAVRYARLKQRKLAFGSATLPVDAGRAADSQEPDDTDSAKNESGEMSINNNYTAARQDGQYITQRGRGTSIIQQSERPTSTKDTSVQIAAAFQQAAVVGNGGASGSQIDVSRRQEVGFLSRAGDRRDTLADSGIGTESEDVASGQDDSGLVAAAALNSAVAPTSSLSPPPPSSASKKRKAPSSSAARSIRSTKGRTDGMYRPPKAGFAEMTSDKLAQDDEDIDSSELYTEVGLASDRTKHGISSATGRPSKTINRKKQKSATKVAGLEGGNRENESILKRELREDSHEDVDQLSESSSDDLAYRALSTRARGRNNGTPHPAALGDAVRENSAAPSAADTNITSYFLHEPSAEPEAIRVGMTQPGAGRLVQTQPLSSTHQPTFAYSTIMKGNTNALNADKSLPARRASLSAVGMDVLSGAQSDIQPLSAIRPGHLADLTKTSSNASFNERGSDYDYAEEERMANALLAQKERQRHGLQPQLRAFPEGRPPTRVLDIYSTRAGTVASARKAFERERDPSTSSDISLTSAQNYAQQRAAQRQAHPLPHTAPSISVASSAARRAPAPPSVRSASVISAEPETIHEELTVGSVQSDQQPSETNLHHSPRFGQRLGKVLRHIVVLLYWVVVRPVSSLVHVDKATLLRWAGVVILLSMILASMYEHDAVPKPKSPSRWHFPFTSRDSTLRFTPPSETPTSMNELVSRLTSLEQSLASLFSIQSADRNDAHERAQVATELTKRLAVLEADFEGERRKVHKAHEALVKAEKKQAEKASSDVDAVKSQLDSVATGLKKFAIQQEASRSLVDDIAEQIKKGDLSRAILEKRISDLSADAAISLQTDAADLRKPIEQSAHIHPQPISLNVRTGDVELHPALLKHLMQILPQTSSADGELSSWEDFLARHEKQFKEFINEVITQQISFGNRVEQSNLQKYISHTIDSVRTELAGLHASDINALTADLDNKLTKIASSRSKSTPIKLDSGENLQTVVKGLIDTALGRYRKDVLAQPDFALYSAGARVIPSLTSPTYSVRPDTWTGSLLAHLSGTGVLRGLPPVTALHPDTAVGRCWAFEGHTGQLGILLSRDIYPTSITIEHASKDLAIDVSSAPKRFEAWGIVESKQGLGVLHTARPDSPPTNRILLVSNAYDAEASDNIQTFPVSQEVQDLGIPINMVVLHVLDNHGNQHLSCLYRIRVGGTLATQAPDA